MKNAHKNKFNKYIYLHSVYKFQGADDDLANLLIGEKNKTDSKIMKTIGQMIKPYLELEASLSYMTPKDKATVLSTSFLSSQFSYNPVKSLKEISEMYRSNQGLKIITEHLSLAENITVQQASAWVEEAIRNSSFIHRMNN
ncbi:MAG: hypothetical protein L0H53_12430 [Candidatus Nitrosocosmicus sp.]|nr:hypothetical protein [Candidatus Nitrosocosmicus sp.]